MKDFVRIYESLKPVDENESLSYSEPNPSLGDVKGYFVLSNGEIAVKANMSYRSIRPMYALYALNADKSIDTMFAVDKHGWCLELAESRDKREYNIMKYVNENIHYHVFVKQKPYTNAQVGAVYQDVLITELAQKRVKESCDIMKSLCGDEIKRHENFIEIETEYGVKRIDVHEVIDKNNSAVQTILGNYEIVKENLEEKYYENKILLEHMQINHKHVFTDILEPHIGVTRTCKYCGYQEKYTRAELLRAIANGEKITVDEDLKEKIQSCFSSNK